MRAFLDGFGNLLPALLEGARVTLTFCVISMLLALVIGLLVAGLRLYGPLPARLALGVYIEFFRNTPILLQLYILYYGLLPLLGFRGVLSPLTTTIGRVAGLPFPETFNDAIVAGVGALALNYGAYEAENIRAGLQSVDRGQWEAAQSLGLRTLRILRRVVIPQALRVIIPPVTNDFIYLFKDSAILSVITIIELTAVAQQQARQSFENTPYLYAAIVYLCMSYPTSLCARWLERRAARGLAAAR